jgi:hypothetical protein
MFLEDLPFGEHTKDDDQKISPASEFLENFVEKRR